MSWIRFSDDYSIDDRARTTARAQEPPRRRSALADLIPAAIVGVALGVVAGFFVL